MPVRSALAILSTAAAALSAQQFRDDFRKDTLAAKPSFTIVGRRLGPERGVQNPAIIEGSNGALVAAWSNKGAPGGHWVDNDVNNTIVASTSLDGGKTWSEPVEAAGPSSINPTFLRDPKNGEIWLIYNRNRSTIQDDTNIWYVRSADNGRTWSGPKEIDTGFPVDIVVHNGIVLPNGEWLIPFHYDRSGQGSPFSVTRAEFVASVIISADRGRTWKRYGAVEAPNRFRHPNRGSWAVEPAVAETGGRLVMTIRTRTGYLWQSESSDKGRTWSIAKPMPFSNPDSKESLVALKNGKLLLCWNHTKTQNTRYPLLASMSDNGGRSWNNTITLNDDNVQMDYPATIEKDGEILVVYGHALREIRLIRLCEPDFGAGWTVINQRESWAVRDGLLQAHPSKAVENAHDWLRWSKAVAFDQWPTQGVRASVDFRLDGDTTDRDAAIGVFPAYQDEGNWAAWVWYRRRAHAGLERQEHFGSPHIGHSRDDARAWLGRIEPRRGMWYRLEIESGKGQMSWTLRDRSSGAVVERSSERIDAPGSFFALGTRGVQVSFDNVTVAANGDRKETR